MKKILVIEDEPEMCRNLTTILRMEKFHPLPAENGRVGIELAKKEKPDLILCDVMMPELDGYGVIAALRANAETVAIPFIFLTAKGVEHPSMIVNGTKDPVRRVSTPVRMPRIVSNLSHTRRLPGQNDRKAHAHHAGHHPRRV